MADHGPWYVKYASKVLGVVTSVVCFVTGIVSLIGLSVGCIIAGVILILISIVVMTLEAPFCCAMIPQLQKLNDFSERRSPLQRIIFYGIAAVLPVSMCFGISTIFSALVLGGSCAFNVWKYIQERRAPRTGDTAGIVIGSAPPSSVTAEMGQAAPAQSSQIGLRDQLVEKAAVGAVRGAMSGGYPSGPYSGF
ncbi:hypothetical protein D915_005774 [Fasciola hepatica]|uniref:Calcium channel flower n=1 Tax=Fasciola hepatica TaxID=6192 RepID=A0A4E0R8N3_FASHE|nr:hypothetical protein D915_005774 [Fasciola hepatica]